MTTRRLWRAGTLLGTAAVLLAAGCAADDEDSAGSSSESATEDVAVASGADAASGEEGGAASTGATTPGGSPPALELVAAEREVVRTGSLRLTVPASADAADSVRRIAGDAGGFVSDEQVRAAEDEVTITVRMPSDQFDDVLDGISDLGDVVEQDVQVEDVTAEVVDIDSRVESLRASVERVRALLAGAGTVDQLAAVEGQLTSRETELEALLGQQRVLADQVALGTLTVHLTTDPAPAPDEDAAGFMDGLRRGWVVLVDGARIALAVTGFLLPLALPAVPIALAVWWWLRRRRPIVAAEG
jgi:hypothetical protein